MQSLFLSPHADDAVLFGCFTLQREKPLVLTITDSWIQFNRGEGITADQRWLEDVKAMKVLGCPIIRGGIRDDTIQEWMVKILLQKFSGFDTFYAPAVMGGNPHHDMVGKVAREIWGEKCQFYTTYTKESFWVPGIHEVDPTSEEVALKEKALACYESQIKINKPYFSAVKGKKEGFI